MKIALFLALIVVCGVAWSAVAKANKAASDRAIIEAAKQGQPLLVFGDGSQTRCFGYVEDAVEALIRLQH